LVVGVGTGGTITGMARYLKEQNPEIKVVGVDPEGSIYTAESDEEVTSYLIEGVGEDFWPAAFDPSVVDEYEMVGDKEAFLMARRVVREEGIFVGGSGGMALVGALRSAARYPDELVVVVIPDSGRNYISKIFDDEWMASKGMLEES
jgi:cystathionine beta-synthase